MIPGTASIFSENLGTKKLWITSSERSLKTTGWPLGRYSCGGDDFFPPPRIGELEGELALRHVDGDLALLASPRWSAGPCRRRCREDDQDRRHRGPDDLQPGVAVDRGPSFCSSPGRIRNFQTENTPPSRPARRPAPRRSAARRRACGRCGLLRASAGNQGITKAIGMPIATPIPAMEASAPTGAYAPCSSDPRASLRPASYGFCATDGAVPEPGRRGRLVDYDCGNRCKQTWRRHAGARGYVQRSSDASGPATRLR